MASIGSTFEDFHRQLSSLYSNIQINGQMLIPVNFLVFLKALTFFFASVDFNTIYLFLPLHRNVFQSLRTQDIFSSHDLMGTVGVFCVF